MSKYSGTLSEKDLKAAFKVFDENNDGFISAAELEYMLTLLGGGSQLTKEETMALIASVDTNGDGKIDYTEFAALMSSMLY